MAEELAWAAGFFDGEGNARFRSGSTFVLQAAQVHREPLDRFCAAVNGGKVYGPYDARTPNRKPYYHYSVAGMSAQEAYTSLRPHLCSVKRAQGDEALAAYSQHISYKRMSPSRLEEIRQRFAEHTDPLVGTRINGSRPISKASSFGHRYAQEFGYTPSGLRLIAKKIEDGRI